MTIKNYTEKEVKEIAAQLRCPFGDEGVQIASLMENTNSSMINVTIERLDLKKDDVLLELGPGNGFHLERILEQCRQVFTVDISELMISNISRKYKKFIDEERLKNFLGDGRKIPISREIIDKAFTVNTIYFWKEPKDYLNEIGKCMRSGGELYITYAHKKFMETLPFSNYGFKLYDEKLIESISCNKKFTIENQKSYKEIVTSKLGEDIEREFVIAKLIKN